MMLKGKQQRFVEEYLIDLNATQAAIRAGYSAKTAQWVGPRLVTKSHVSEAIQSAMVERGKRTEITQDRVLKEFARIAFFDPAKMFDDTGRPLQLKDIDEDTRRAIAGVDVATVGNSEIGVGEIQKIKIASKLVALEQIGKHLGMFTGKQGDDETPPPTKVEIIVKDARRQQDTG